MFTCRTSPHALVAAALLALGAAACTSRPEPARLDESLPADPAPAGVPDDPIADWELPPGAFEHAERLYAQQCALCHGTKGRGDGPAAALLLPPPRDFGEGRFQLVSTDNAYPTNADLQRVLTRGLPGSSMPAFAWMPAADRQVLVDYVRKLTIEAMVDRLTRRGVDEEEAFEMARVRMSPGTPLAVGPAPTEPPSAAQLERGRAIYRTTCAPCHGDDGRGRREEPRWNERGDIEWARDLTSGILKGGASFEQLVYRVESGMPGSSMPATRFADPAERAALIAYVQSLLPDDAEDKLVHHRGTLTAARVDELPRAADELAWRRAKPLDVVLAPNSWRDDSIFGASVQALHDGERIAIRVCWSDDNRNDRPFGEFEFPDQVALMLSGAGDVPPYGMGSAEQPVDLWQWAAFELQAVPGSLELIDNELHQRGDVLAGGGITDVPGYVPARDAPERARILRAHGMDAPPEAQEGPAIEADARWSGDGWAVVFVRSLAAPSRRQVALMPGGRAQLALAVWNGAARDHGGQKSVSIWQELRLAP